MACVMIIDDDADFAAAIATVLRQAGHEVTIEASTEAAKDRMEQRPPDLVILDVMFPENISGGFELARTMRHFSEKLKGVPILMLTAVNTRFPLSFSARDIDDEWLPVADFIEKPVDLQALPRRVEEMLRKSSAQR